MINLITHIINLIILMKIIINSNKNHIFNYNNRIILINYKLIIIKHLTKNHT